MSDLSLQRVGETLGGSGTAAPFRGDVTGAQVVTDAHGRFQEAALRGKLFSGGMTTTSISNATFTTGTLTASCTPIIGLWNPPNTGKNLLVLQVRMQLIANAVTTFTGPGGLVWASSTGQSAISTGITPWNRLSLSTSGSVGKVYANTALTGLSGSLVVQEASGLFSFSNNFSNALTAAGQATAGGGGIDNIDGAIVVAPGAIIALLGTTTPSSVSAATSILWEEVPLLS